MVMAQAWISIQRAETLLIRAAAHQNPTMRAQLFKGSELDASARQLVVRMACGFDPGHLTAADYLVRYPFSAIEAIQAGLEQLVGYSVVSANGNGTYAVTGLGEQVVRRWMERVAAMIQSLDLGAVPPADVQRLLEYDLRIVQATQAASRPHGHAIFNHRLRGLQPDYDPPALWHHWQLVWTMLAASEDEEEHIRKSRGMEPTVWFARRQIWFAHRRPWRARVKTLDDLVLRATGYSPIDRAENRCRQAIGDLEKRGWVQVVDGEFRLTPEGLAICDEDEREIDEGFLSCWPAVSTKEIDELLGITARMNLHLEELSELHTQSAEG
jgi:hypothetical protein